MLTLLLLMLQGVAGDGGRDTCFFVKKDNKLLYSLACMDFDFFRREKNQI